MIFSSENGEFQATDDPKPPAGRYRMFSRRRNCPKKQHVSYSTGNFPESGPGNNYGTSASSGTGLRNSDQAKIGWKPFRDWAIRKKILRPPTRDTSFST
jgi:hypothetical protein